MRRGLSVVLLAVGGLGALTGPAVPAPGTDPLEPASTGGLAAVDRALARLATHRRLLVVGAHPDDEDTSTLAWVSRALGGESAYLALSRGDGGQNLIGPELGVGLGLLRSEELLAARRIEGGRQFFTRAYDFGYTRSLDETLSRWPKQALLADAMRVLRRFKPQVIVSVFPDDGRGGHGQHQAAGVVAHEIWRLAQDPTTFPELVEEGLPPWRPQALYRPAWFSPEDATLVVPMGSLEAISGRSVQQIAAASRSMHRSQDMGRTEPLGGAERALEWVAGGAGAESSDPFAGIDTSLGALADPLPEGAVKDRVRTLLAAVERRAVEARDVLSPLRLPAAAEALAAIVGDLAAAREEAGALADPQSAIVVDLLDEKVAIAAVGLAAAAGVAVEAKADREAVVAGGDLAVTLEVWNAGGGPITLRRAQLLAASGWSPPALDAGPREVAAGELVSLEPSWTVGAIEPTAPYFLRRPLSGDLYDVADVDPAVLGQPFEPPPLSARFELVIGGRAVTLEREVVHVHGDQALGEVRRPLRAVPAVEVSTSPDLVLWPAAEDRPRRIEVHVRSHRAEAVSGILDVELGAGLFVAPIEFTIEAGAGEVTIPLELAPPPGRPSGGFTVRATARVGDGPATAHSYPLVDYPHIRPRPLPTPAATRVVRFDLVKPKLERIGYVRGASDRVPEILERLGLPVEVLTAETLADGDLSVFDVIVIGSRAYEVDPALGAANARLLEYATAGGAVVVQYQQYQYIRGGFAPHALDIGRPHGRVTDETAPVQVLAPGHPVLSRPNRIRPQDWAGWVQERGLYFPESWDQAWRPLVAMHDPGGEEQQGALLVADVGEGVYVYTGLAFFRQIPAGVPGALRLFVNLLALGERPEEPR